MKNPTTGRDIQRSEFVDSLYNNLRRKTAEKIKNHEKLVLMASSYVKDGLELSECTELLMIEGDINREAAEGYINMVVNSSEDKGLYEYSFQFEDSDGKLWSSHDIRKVVRASNEDEAWTKAEEAISEETTIDGEKVISVNRI